MTELEMQIIQTVQRNIEDRLFLFALLDKEKRKEIISILTKAE